MNIEETKLFLKGHKLWNGGLGLIVPRHIGKILKEMGITEGYTVNTKLSQPKKEQ